MKEQLKLLEELQQYDARLQEYETGLKSLPEKLTSLKADLAKMEALLDKRRAELADTEKSKRDQELQLKIDEANVAKAKTKLQAVKTGKDHMAAQREVEASRKMIQDREEGVVKMMEVVEAARKHIAQHEADVAQLREVVAKEEAVIAARVEELRGKVGAEKVLREKAAARVEPSMLKRYAAIRMRRGLAVVPVVNGTCKGCHMAIPPQLFITLQKLRSVETCPTCARIIYWDEIMKDQKMEQAEKPTS
jgi:predicted  nucleic acid-binding Zn-ribbon protein